MPLDLLVPDLLLPPQAPAALRELRLPALERWLARADLARASVRGSNAMLTNAFGLEQPAPIAALTLAADDAPRPGSWLRADPVHLRVGQDAVALHDASILEVTREEATALVAELQAQFASDGLAFFAPTPGRWYVQVPGAELPNTTPIEDAIGRNVFRLLPRGTGRINWHSAITEIQMVFAAHGVNAERERLGRPAINSVWFWGEGALPATVASPYALVYANDPLARGLARVAGTRGAPLPASFAGADAVRESESALMVLDSLTAPLRRGDEDEWKREALKLDATWFAGLGEAIERFESVRVILPGPTDARIATLTGASRWRWFRPRKPLATHA